MKCHDKCSARGAATGPAMTLQRELDVSYAVKDDARRGGERCQTKSSPGISLAAINIKARLQPQHSNIYLDNIDGM